MTESIFVPFRLTTREACEKAAEVLLGPPGKPVKGDAELECIEGSEALKAYTEKLLRRRMELQGEKVELADC